MATKIEWTDETWNPLIGCSRISEGCDHCYAISTVHRGLAPQHEGLTVHVEGQGTDWNGTINIAGHRLDEPLRRTTPTRYFVNSLSDLFHQAVTDETIARIFAVMAVAEHHTFQVLTKRPQRMAELLCSPQFQRDVASWAIEVTEWEDAAWSFDWPLPNVWLGTSIELDKYSWRADHLRRTPAAVRFISAEPLLGPLPSLDLTEIDWLIAGGESGPGARPTHPIWIRALRDRCHPPRPSEHCPAAPENDPGHCGHWDDCEPCCRCGDDTIDPECDCQRCSAARPPRFFFKQWGDWLPYEPDPQTSFLIGQAPGEPLDGRDLPARLVADGEASGWRADDDALVWKRVGKAAAGRLLDGRTWDELPDGAGR